MTYDQTLQAILREMQQRKPGGKLRDSEILSAHTLAGHSVGMQDLLNRKGTAVGQVIWEGDILACQSLIASVADNFTDGDVSLDVVNKITIEFIQQLALVCGRGNAQRQVNSFTMPIMSPEGGRA